MPKGVIIALSVFAIFLIGGPVASAMGTHSPIVGVVAGVIVFLVLSAVFSEKK